jgi:hypothetical protein
VPFERHCSRSPSRARPVAEDVAQKGRQFAERADAGDSAGRDVLDPSEHVTRRLRAGVEMEHERSLR